MLTRYRIALVKYYQSQKNRITKVLEASGIKLRCLVSNVFGKAATSIINDLLDGKDNLYDTALKRGKRLKASTLEIAKSIDGNLDEGKRELLNLMNKCLKILKNQITDIDYKISQKMESYKQQWQLLQTIPAIDAISSPSIIAEIEVDMKQFHESKLKISSWAGICPSNNESAGKKKKLK